MKSIINRRSIRKYKDQPVSDETVLKLLEAAMCAPSAGNQRPWHFIVVKDKNMLQNLAELSPYSSMCAHCAVAVIVCGDIDYQKFEGYWVQDCSAATQNLLTACMELELGAVWLGVYPLDDRIDFIKNLFDLPPNILPLNVISIGYPAEELKSINRFDESRVHFEKW